MSYDTSQATASSQSTGEAPAAFSDKTRAVALPRSESIVELFYCCRCTKMILPAGSNGTVLESGRRFCTICAPFEVKDAPPTGVFVLDKQPSSRRTEVKMSSSRVKPVPTSDGTAASQSGVSRGSAITVRMAQSSSRNAPAKPARKLLWIGVAAMAVMALLVMGILFKGAPKVPPATPVKLDAVILEAVKLPGAPDTQSRNSKAPVDAAPVRKLTEKEERQLALAQRMSAEIKGSEISKKPETAPVEPTVDTKKPAAVVEAISETDYDSQIGAVSTLIEEQRFSTARAHLDAARKKAETASWWESKKDFYAKTNELLQERVASFDRTATEAAAALAAAGDLAAIEEQEKVWKAKSELGPLTAKSAERVLVAARNARARVSKSEAEKRFAPLAGTLDNIVKKSKAKLTKQETDYLLKTLGEFKGKLGGDAAAIDLFADRIAALNADLRLARGPERLLYHLDACGSERCELKYDFSNSEQFEAWKFEGDGEGSGSAELDAKAKRILLKANKEHSMNGKDKRAPLIQVPFYFNAANWIIEAEVAAQSREHEKDKNLNPTFGIFLSDGAGGILRFSVKEASKGTLHFAARGPGIDDKDKSKQASVPGKQEDKTKLIIACQDGAVSFGARVVSSREASCGRSRLANFEPKFAGVYVETPDKEESATVSISNLKITGVWDKAKQKKAIEDRLSGDAAALKSELLKNPKPPAPK